MTSRLRLTPLLLIATGLTLAAGCGHKDGAASGARGQRLPRPGHQAAPTTFDPAMVEDGHDD